MSKGLTINEFGTIALMFGVAAIVISIGGSILTQVRSTQTANTIDYNATTSGLTGIDTMADWLPTIAIIIAAAIVIGVIVNHFRTG